MKTSTRTTHSSHDRTVNTRFDINRVSFISLYLPMKDGTTRQRTLVINKDGVIL
jgi:hypothetical protein